MPGKISRERKDNMKTSVYAIGMLIVALGLTSCGNRKAKPRPPELEICDFNEADVEDSPTCGCENYPEAGKIYVVKFTTYVPTMEKSST